jgi:CubicO group peptidase (beta-lactamase class C family)
MSRIHVRRGAFVFILLLGANIAHAAANAFPAAAPESQGLSSQSLAQLRDVVKGFVDKGDIVGGELLVIKNRRTVLHEAMGLGDRERQKPLKTGTIYCIRSMTKPLVGAAVQILVDEGRLSLDDTAAKYLPAFDNDKSRGVTIRQLLTHTGGLPLSSLLTTNLQTLSSLRDVADLTGKNGPTVPPGSKFQYSDDGADTLGAIVSVVSGQPAEVFIQARILEPLGMRDTYPYPAAAKKLDRFTSAYAGSRDNWIRIWSPGTKPMFPYFLASQSAYSTTHDYARFLALYLDGGVAGGKRVLSEAAVKRTLEPATATGFPSGFPKASLHYGQMMLEYVDAERKVVAFGHGGSDGTFAYAWPEQDLMVLFYTQSRGTSTSLEFEAAVDRLLLGGSQAPATTQDLTAETAAPYLGLYWLDQHQKAMVVVFDKDRLALEIPSQGLVALKETDEPEAWSLVEAPGNSVKFHRSDLGPVTGFDFRSAQTLSLQRLEPEAGLPRLEELLARRPENQRAARLESLGHIRMSGTLETTAGQQKGTFEMLAAGEDRSSVTFNLGGAESRQSVNGKRAWARYAASMPVQEMPEPMARAMRLNGWLLATGDWHAEYAQVRVLKRVELERRPAFLVHAAPAQGRQRLVYVDAENGLTLGYDEVQELPGMGMVGCEVRFADYRDVDGVRIPFKASAKFPTPMLGTLTYQVDRIETRVKLNKDPFTMK